MLTWEPFKGDAEIAKLGEVTIGMIVPVSADHVVPGTWAFQITGVDVKWIARRSSGHVKGKGPAKRAVNQAFSAWAERAGISRHADGGNEYS